MKNESSIEVKDGYLLVTSKGVRSEFNSVIEGTNKINEAAKNYGLKYVLADYRNVKYDVPIADAFNLVKVYENKLPIFNEIIICAVTNEESLEIAQFWESICNRRGYNYKVFTDFDKAEHWLTKLIKQNNLQE